MDSIFSTLSLVDVQDDLVRNIVSLRESQNLFDDLSDSTEAWSIAQRVEDAVKPSLYHSQAPIIHRPFEDAEWFNAIEFPFKNWQASRFSNGSFGVWYGSSAVETTIYETAYHWYRRLLSDAGFENEEVVIERKIYNVYCQAALLDFRAATKTYPKLIDKTDYTLSQMVGSRLCHEGHPGLLAYSARRVDGEVYAVFNPQVLSKPRYQYALTYRLHGQSIQVEKVPGSVWMVLPVENF